MTTLSAKMKTMITQSIIALLATFTFAPAFVQAQAIESCEDLAPRIVQMTEGEYNTMLKIHSIKPLTRRHCLALSVAPPAYEFLTKEFYKGCVDATGPEGKRYRKERTDTSTKFNLSCIGKVRWSRSEEKTMFFYWEVFPDGEGFIGYTGIFKDQYPSAPTHSIWR